MGIVRCDRGVDAFDCAQQIPQAHGALHNDVRSGLFGGARVTHEVQGVAEVDIAGDKAQRFTGDRFPAPVSGVSHLLRKEDRARTVVIAAFRPVHDEARGCHGIVARRHGAAYLPDVLIRARHTDSQGGKSGAGRRRNVAGAFACPRQRWPRIEGKRLVLIDDVLTTGATAEACARVLKAAGAARVDVAAVARVKEIEVRPI